MMQTYLNRLALAALDQRLGRYEELKDPEQIRAYQVRMKEFFAGKLGGFPERTPLNAQVVGMAKGTGYRLEKILFESQPDHHVTAILYLPETLPPYPGVLVPCGHSAEGKAAETYQRVSILLAMNGMAAFCYDPIGQGERSQILDSAGRPQYGSTTEHTLAGVGCILLGTNTARYRIFDGMRAIDYLFQRPDIDPDRIGCTGNSGGGTLTSYLMALDERIVCAAPSCYLTTFGRLLETIGPQDAEQNIHAQIAWGMDHPDYVIMRAPAPTLYCTATHDFFDIGGAWNNFRQAKRIYTRLGFPERLELVETDAKHGFSTQLRVAAVRWMRRWLLRTDDAITESDFSVWTREELRCSPAGQVMRMPGERSIFDLNAVAEKELAKRRQKFWSQTPRQEALAKVRELIGCRVMPPESRPIGVKVGSSKRDGYVIEKLVLEREKGIVLPALMFVPPNPDGNPYLYLHGEGKHKDAQPGGPIEQLVKGGHLVLAVDLRGIGETQGGTPKRRGSTEMFGTGWKDYFRAYLLGKSYVGMRTEDVMTCAEYLRQRLIDGRSPRIHLLGIGEAGIPALHAAALEPDLFQSIELTETIDSWSSVINDPEIQGQLINTVHGALQTYDLSDLKASWRSFEEHRRTGSKELGSEPGVRFRIITFCLLHALCG